MLNRYYGQDRSLLASQEIGNSRLRALVRSIIPHKVQTAIRAGCSDVRASNGRVPGFVAECVLDLPPDEVAAAAEVLKADSQLLRYLTEHVAVLSSVRGDLRGDIAETNRAIELLQGADSVETPLENNQS